jgi:UDP-N-acetylglucosamine transferase subunit ALG13
MFVLATVGTDHHPFDRFINWIDAWHADHNDVDVFVQYGTCNQTPVSPGSQWVEGHELAAMMARADAIVCHGGPSTIIEARTNGTVPVVLPRNPALGEHVDGHQMRFADFMAEQDNILLARTKDDLATHLGRVLGGEVAAPEVSANQTATLAQFSSVLEDLLAKPCRPLLGVRGR